jgi:hypothetical protein
MATERDKYIQTLTELADGCECAAEVEKMLMNDLQHFMDAFLKHPDGARDERTMRFVRVYNESRSHHDNMTKQAAAARYALAVIRTHAPEPTP